MSNSGIFPTDEWALSEGETDKGPVFIRFRRGDPAVEDQQKFSTLIVVIWEYEPRDDSGLPTSATMDEMDEFEARILDASDADRDWGSCVAVITFNGAREWRFYTPDVEIFQNEFSNALSGLGPYPLQFDVLDDPEWLGLSDIRDNAR